VAVYPFFMTESTWATDLFDTLLAEYGPQSWWPGEHAIEIIVGAILTQRTSWENAARAISSLKAQGLLAFSEIDRARSQVLEAAIRPSGCFRAKAAKLKAFAAHVMERHTGSLDRFLALPTGRLREELLGIHGVGPETADAIALYAAKVPLFVVDAYTRRLLERLGRLLGGETYDAVQQAFTQNLPEDAVLFNEYHALIVRHGKDRCRTRPVCADCPLASECSYPPFGGVAV